MTTEFALPRVGDPHPVAECTVVAGDALISMAYDWGEEGFVYLLSKVDAHDGIVTGLRPQLLGIVNGVCPDEDGAMLSAIAGLPDGYEEDAVIISDRGDTDMEHAIEEVEGALGLSENELSELIMKAWSMTGWDGNKDGGGGRDLTPSSGSPMRDDARARLGYVVAWERDVKGLTVRNPQDVSPSRFDAVAAFPSYDEAREFIRLVEDGCGGYREWLRRVSRQ